MIDKIDITMERYIINKYISMTKLFDELKIDYRTDSNFYCPFHENYNTPSARLYNDKDGTCLWCYSEGRMYKPFNVYKTFYRQIDTNKLALMILNNLPEQIRDNELQRLDLNEVELEDLPYKDSLLEFKQHKINIKELLNRIANSYNDNI